jgi:hypothetical protein
VHLALNLRFGGRCHGLFQQISNSQSNKEEVMQKRELERIEKQIKELHATLKSLDDGAGFEKLSHVIRKPWWTTVAEVAFVTGILDSMLGQAKNMSRLKQALFAGAEKVELNPQPLPPKK